MQNSVSIAKRIIEQLQNLDQVVSSLVKEKQEMMLELLKLRTENQNLENRVSIAVEEINVIALSSQSPLGNKLMGNEIGFSFEINGTKYLIESIE